MPQKLSYMIEINPDDVIEEFLKRGITRTEGAKRLLPYYERRDDAYHVFKNWMRKRRMPRDIYEDMESLLDGTD